MALLTLVALTAPSAAQVQAQDAVVASAGPSDPLQALQQAFQGLLDHLLGKPAEQRVGKFEVRDGVTSGSFVDFKADEAGCAVRDLRVHGVAIAREVRALGSGPGTQDWEARATGAVWEMGCGGLGRLRAHDAPATLVHAWSEGEAAVRWTLAEGLTVQRDAAPDPAPADTDPTLGAAKVALRIAQPGLNATLLLDNAVQVDERTWVAEAGTLIAHADNILVPRAANVHRDSLERAKVEGLVGAEVTVLRGAPGLVADVATLDVLDVTVDEPAPGRIRFQLLGSEASGRVVVANLGEGLLEGPSTTVQVYDRTAGGFVPIPAAQAQGGLADVLDPGDDLAPEYWVVHDQDGRQVLLSVPRFRAVAFEVQGLLEVLGPDVVPGALAGFGLVALAALNLTRRRSHGRAGR